MWTTGCMWVYPLPQGIFPTYVSEEWKQLHSVDVIHGLGMQR